MIDGGIFDAFKGDFLNLDHSNFEELISEIDIFKKIIVNNSGVTMSDSLTDEGISKVEILQGLSSVFQTVPDRNHPKVVYNIIPSPMMSTVALNTLIQLYNPNAILDELSGGFVECEKNVVKILSDLVGWNKEKSLGISTFGGKGTLLYPIKIGINKARPDAIQNGVSDDIVVLTGVNNHYSITDICNFLGIGTKNCIRVDGTILGTMDLHDLELKMKDCIESGKKIACIIASGGETINHGMDNVREVYEIRERLVKQYSLSYIPHIHSDSVNGWIWLFFKNYDFTINKLGLEDEIISAITYHVNIMKTVKYADSYAVDFHKTGLCPYVSAFFVTKDKQDLISISEASMSSHNAGLIGDVLPCSYTLEHSRSCTSIGSAYFVLQYLGIEGFQKYIIYLLRIGFHIKNLIKKEYDNQFEIINNSSFWVSSVIIIKFSQINAGFQELLVMSETQKSVYNNLSMQLLSRINVRRKEGKSKLYIGYIANHNHNGKATNIHVFKIYPISLHYTEENIKELLDEIILAKNEVEALGGEMQNIHKSDIHILR